MLSIDDWSIMMRLARYSDFVWNYNDRMWHLVPSSCALECKRTGHGVLDGTLVDSSWWPAVKHSMHKR